MHAILKLIRSLFYSLLLFTILLISVLTFFVTTTPGLYLIVKLASFGLPGKLHITHLQGRLIDTISFDKLSYEDDEVSLDFDNFHMQWQLNTLLHKKIIINALKSTKLAITLKNEKTTPHFPKLPVDLIINQASIQQLQITKHKITLSFSDIDLQAHFTNSLWQLLKLDFHFIGLNGHLTASLQPHFPYTLSSHLRFKPLASFGPNWTGTLDIGGDILLYHWHGDVNPLNFILNGTLRNGQELHLFSNWHQFLWPLNKEIKIDSPSGSLRIEGLLPELTIHFKATTQLPFLAEWKFNAQTTGAGIKSTGLIKSPQGNADLNIIYDNTLIPHLQGKIHATSSNLNQKKSIQPFNFNTELTGNSLQDLTLNADVKTAYLDNLLTGIVHYQNKRVKGQVTIGKNQLQIEGTLPYPWQLKATAPEPGLLHPALKGLQTNIVATGSLKNATQGNLVISIPSGSYYLPNGNSLSALQFNGGQLRMQLTPNRLHINGNLTVDKQKSLALDLKLPHFQLEKGFSTKQPIEGTINVAINSLAFFENFGPALTKIEGQLHTALKIRGTLDKPILEGNTTLDKTRIFSPKSGLDLNPVQLKMQSHGNQWNIEGSLASQGRLLTLHGQGALSPQFIGSITIRGDNIPFIKTDEYIVNLSPKLAVTIAPNAINIAGTIHVPEAELKPRTFTKTVGLTEDAVFAGVKPAPSLFPVSTDVQLEMGNHVKLNMQGLQGLLVGTVRLQKLPQGLLNANGELTIRDGKYQAYGQDLVIEQGQLIYTGGEIANPGIHIRAIRRFNNTPSSFAGSNQLLDFNSSNLQTIDLANNMTVGIEVTGRLHSIKTQLFSNPPTLQQADILSMLLLGKPITQADHTGGEILLSAISSMKLGSGTKGMQLLNQLKQTLGVDVNIKTSTVVNQQTHQISESNTVVVGKSLSKRLYLSYNVGLAQSDINVLTLTYLLNKFLSIQVNTSTNANGVDLLYTREGRAK
ncbi:translocation/assembly module TamB domain-containing protein [Legionella fairfieldensis]|uniref:translocation/assembly module TamB domain-containing protein n=1 Tax=Legionella fairfieldensis TaxID=45064 RepID=UPI000684D5F5|nr:translocation/assembly module TamB domain-containing protein [Legionella fairfieldensis]